MRWLLARYCVLALINLSVAQNNTRVVFQKPRFYGLRVNQEAHFYCYAYTAKTAKAEWYKANMNGEKKEPLWKEPRFILSEQNKLILRLLNTNDTGVYYCKLDGIWGPGTGLQVYRVVNPVEAQYRSQMKDGLIVLQGLLLAVFIAAILLRKHSLDKQNDSLYEEPETDHIYEGLAIETCGGGLYEELSVYTQAEGGEAPWE